MKKASKIAIGAGVGAVVLLGGAYVAAYFVAGNQVPVDATVEGVAIGGQSPDEAVSTLEAAFGDSLAQPYPVTAGDLSASLDPAASGLSADYEATVVAAGGGFSWNPLDIIDALTGGEDVSLVRVVDEDALSAALSDVAGEFSVEGESATLGFEDGEIVTTDAVQGTELVVDDTVESVTDAFTTGLTSAEAVVDAADPAVTDEMVAAAVADYAEPILSGPVTLTYESNSMELAPEAIAGVTTFEVDGDELAPVIDGEALLALDSTVEAQESLELDPPKDASYTFSDGKPAVVPAKSGEVLETEPFTEAVTTAATAEGDGRTAAVTVATKQPEFSTEDAEQLVPREVIGEFTTYFPYAEYRNVNLGQAASSVNGTVLMPDDIFSLNDTLGERTVANGYIDGYVINGGRLVKESGGGISQSATTLYNAAFFAGYEDIEHKPHSLYFDRYPAGREATIYYGALDMRFRNDTEYPAIIQGYIRKASSGQSGSLTFRIWSRPTYTNVTSTDLVKSGFYSGEERVVDAENCEPQAPIQGFTVTWQRLFWQGSDVVKREDYRWKYSAGDEITCA